MTRHQRSSGTRRPRGVLAALAALTGLAGLVASGVAAATPATAAPRTDLYLVTLDGAGTAASTTAVVPWQRVRMQVAQDALLTRVGAGEPVYRWTTALNGMAVRLTPAQAEQLATIPEVTSVERDEVRPLASTDGDPSLVSPSARGRGGAGVVIGVVDSGLDADSPLFASGPGLGRDPRGFRGSCAADLDWARDSCNDKVVGGAWFVDGFGRDRLGAQATLSPLDDVGHGTEMASIAAGNSDVSVRVGGHDLGQYSGVAPQARLAAYKACWTAPDPSDDGCSTADLVAAIDRATADRVDVLNLSVGGPARIDTVERALLGATEAGIVVVGAAGNDTDGGTAHPTPWVTTVGASSGVERTGSLRLGHGRQVSGAMVGPDSVGPARLVLGSHAAAPGSRRADARICAPGSLDAGVVRDRVVLCERGGVGRVDKSAAVAAADGVGMVLANTGRQPLEADFHSVPTVHLDLDAAREVLRWAHHHPAAKVSLVPTPAREGAARVLGWSATGNARSSVLKPDVVAPGEGVLGARPGTDQRWEFVSGTSAATAYTSGAAARLLAHHGWEATSVRSALVTTAEPLSGSSVLSAGAGRVRPQESSAPGLVVRVRPQDYRRWLDGGLTRLNTPTVVMPSGGSTTRTVTNAGKRARYFSSSVGGFARHRVTVTPAAVRLGPGESATFTIRTTGAGQDDGWVLWRGATGTRTRLPVLLSR